MSKRGLPGVGKRKDGRERVKLTLLVTPRSIEGARGVSPSVSAAFEQVFEGVAATPPGSSGAASLRDSPSGSLPIPDAVDPKEVQQ